MRYDSAKFDELYETWVMQFGATEPDLLIDELARVMRSKLTLLLGTAQILSADLNQLEPGQKDVEHMIETIVRSGRYISVILDAAVDVSHATHKNQQDHAFL